MKILMTSDCVGGVWTYALDLTRQLAADGHQVVVAVMGRELASDQREELDQSGAVAWDARPYRLEWMAHPDPDLHEAGEWLLGLAADHQPDVVHLNQFSFATLPWSVPTLVVAHSDVFTWWRAVHGCDPPGEWQIYRERVLGGLVAANLVIAPTAAMLHDLRAVYDFPTPADVVHNGRRLATTAVEKQERIAAVGRVWDEAKNIAAAVRAARGLPWPLVVAGEGSVHEEGADHVARLTSTQVAELLGRAAIYVAPARYEPFGLAAVEAGVSGCAVVLGDIPSLREVWGDAATFVDPGDEHALRGVLAELISDGDLLRRRQSAARRRAAAFGPAAMAAAYATRYRALCDVNVAEGRMAS